MARDRGEIEKDDFPLVRRGYDPAAVREHLRAVADELERLRAGGGGEETASASASEHVRGILAAAEEAAAEIKRQGSERAREIVQAAEREAQDIRAGAGEAVRRQAASVAQLTADLLDRGGTAEGEIGALAVQLRSAAERLGHGRRGAAPGPGPAPADSGEETLATTAALEHEGSEAFAEPAGPEAAAAEAAAAAPVAASVSAGSGEQTQQPARGDVDGARLVALNMALNGEPREETDRYLAENFDLPDRAALVEEVYAAIDA